MNTKLIEICMRFLEKPVENRKERERKRDGLQTAMMAYLGRRKEGEEEYVRRVSFYRKTSTET